MAAFKILHDRPNCIGCGACPAAAPDFWEMDQEGKSTIKGGKRMPDGTEELEIAEKDLAQNKEAAEACPVNVIHLIDLKNKKKII